MKVRVARKVQEASGISSFELVSTDGAALPAFSAGSHIDVSLENGVTRQYSLCNSPEDGDRYLIAVLRDAASRGGSQAMHEQVEEGSELEISPPKNHFALAHPPQKSLLMAGGIGITPILCMAERLRVLGAPFDLCYAARSRASMAFRQRLEECAFASQVHFFFDEDSADSRLNVADWLERSSDDTHLYVCGPKGFMQHVLDTARHAGWPEDRLHYEFFNAEVVKSNDDGSFKVQIASTGATIVVAKDKTVLQALAAAGIEVPTSCEQGVCGTCLTRVMKGECDHRDMFLMDDERARNDQFLPCVSRARSELLVLDL